MASRARDGGSEEEVSHRLTSKDCCSMSSRLCHCSAAALEWGFVWPGAVFHPLPLSPCPSFSANLHSSSLPSCNGCVCVCAEAWVQMPIPLHTTLPVLKVTAIRRCLLLCHSRQRVPSWSPAHTSVTMVDVKTLWSYCQPSRHGSISREPLGPGVSVEAMRWHLPGSSGSFSRGCMCSWEALGSAAGWQRCSGEAALKF